MKSSLLKKALPHIVAVAVFLIVAVVYTKPLFEGKVVSQSDVINWKAMAQQSFEYKEKYGHFPLWTESAFSGMPSYQIAIEGTSKISTIYLSNILTLGLPQPANYLFLACICFYLLILVLKIDPWIGIMSSLAFGYATFDPVIIAVGHNTQMEALAYLPAMVAGFLLILRGRYLIGSALFCFFFSFQLGTQHLQIIYYTAIILGFISIFALINSWKENKLKQCILALGIAVFAALVGFGTYAGSMLPIQEYAKESMRGGKSELTSEDNKNKTKGGLDKDYAFMWSYGIPETFTLIVPGIYGGGSEGRLINESSKFAEKAAEIGYPEDRALQTVNQLAYWGTQPNTAGPVYLGAVTSFLFVIGLIFTKSWHKNWIISIAVLGILLAWGKNFSSLNYFLFNHFPLYNKFRAPTQALVFPQLAFALLGAFGLNDLLLSKDSKEIIWKKFKLVTYIVTGVLVLLVAFYFTADFKGSKDAKVKDNFSSQIIQSSARGKQPTPEMQQQANEVSSALIRGLQADRQSIFGADLIRTILLIAIAATLTALFIKGKIRPVILIAGFFVICSYDLLAEGRVYLNEDNFVEPNDYDAVFNPTPADVQISKDPDKNFRVFDQASENGWYQDALACYHHNSLGGYSPAKLALYQDIIDNQLMKGNVNVYNMLNTKYILQRNPSTSQVQAALNPNAFGPCWLVKNIHYVKNADEEMKALDSINVRDTAIIDQRFKKYISFLPQADSAASLHLISNTNDTVKYSFSSKTNQFAVFSEVYYDKGWDAYLDGNKTDYCRVDYVLRGMQVPSGNHNIEFRFEPRSFKLGNTITVWSCIIAYLLLIAAIVYDVKRSKIVT